MFKEGLQKPAGMPDGVIDYGEIHARKMAKAYAEGRVTVMWHETKGYRYVETDNVNMSKRRGYFEIDQEPVKAAMAGMGSLPPVPAEAADEGVAPKAKPQRGRPRKSTPLREANEAED